MSYFVPETEMREGGIDPRRAGWAYTGMKVLMLAPGEHQPLVLGGSEALLVPLAGAFTIDLDGRRFQIEGRGSVFAGPPDVVYLPAGSQLLVLATGGGEMAICTAVADPGGEPIYRPSGEIAVEVRGAGAATRQINQLLPADLEGPQRLIVVEVITPDGNWSSYPPHKHDETGESECPLEEIYYFRFDRPGAFGFHRTYTSDGAIDETVTVRHGDAFLVPRGYHGPCAAAPGYSMYYLNTMAGPGPRAWLTTTDPDHAWLWEEWAHQEADPRVPLPFL